MCVCVRLPDTNESPSCGLTVLYHSEDHSVGIVTEKAEVTGGSTWAPAKDGELTCLQEWLVFAGLGSEI